MHQVSFFYVFIKEYFTKDRKRSNADVTHLRSHINKTSFLSPILVLQLGCKSTYYFWIWQFSFDKIMEIKKKTNIGITSKTNARSQQERQKSREGVVGSMEREIQRSIEVGADKNDWKWWASKYIGHTYACVRILRNRLSS